MTRIAAGIAWNLLGLIVTGCGQSTRASTNGDPCDTYFDALLQAETNCGKPAPTGDAYARARARFQVGSDG